MPKKQRIRETENPLGQKINHVMAEKDIAGDYAQLARIFEVATPSTYDWVTHGRLGKERYQRLVEWSGKSLDWWFDIDPSTERKSDPSSLKDGSAAVVHLTSKERWPLEIDLADLQNMHPHDLDLINAYIRGIYDARKTVARKSRKA